MMWALVLLGLLAGALFGFAWGHAHGRDSARHQWQSIDKLAAMFREQDQ